jgi:protein involved in ribonucleotide reduction
VGEAAMSQATTGNDNVAVGRVALRYNIGSNNTTVGNYSLGLNTTGYSNTSSGTSALVDNTTGSNNTACGVNSARGIITGSGNSVFGADVTGLAPNLTNNLILASGGVIRLQHDGVGTTTLQGSIVASGDLSFNSGYGSAAKAYGCRAWVNFNGTGTVAIRASGNVSSITDNGVGNYMVNFATAMPDANFSAVASAFDGSTDNTLLTTRGFNTLNLTVTTVSGAGSGSGISFNRTDFNLVNVAVFR